MEDEAESECRAQAARIVRAFVSRNAVSPSDLPRLIADAYAALRGLGGGSAASPAEPAKPTIAVHRSITPDHLICLNDGKKFKSLKRHLMTHHGLTPEKYREKWGLPKDYPMVAPNYSATRSSLAKSSGLGRKAPSARKGRRSAAQS